MEHEGRRHVLDGFKMKPLVTKKTIFQRKLDGKPIVVMMLLPEQRKRFGATRELFYKTGIYKKLDDFDDHGRNCEVMHTIHYVVPRAGEAHVSVIEKGRRWHNEAYGDSPHFLP